MLGVETSRTANKRGIKQQMAAEAAAIASLLQENGGVRISESPMSFQGTPETYEAMNSQNSNPKGKGKDKGNGNGKGKENIGVHISEPPISSQATPETNEAMNSENSNPKSKGKGNGNGKGKYKSKTKGPKTVIFNRLGQPVVDNAAPLAHCLVSTDRRIQYPI